MICIQISWLLWGNHKSNKKAKFSHKEKVMVPKDNTRRKLDCANASCCPPPRLVGRGKFLRSYFCLSAKVRKGLSITKTSLSRITRKQEKTRTELKHTNRRIWEDKISIYGAFFPLDVSSLRVWYYNFKGHFSADTKIPKQGKSCM